ncbi:MAG: hypothetical protein PHR35_22670, partial [Kiritimatiellae bacterium]|nr:hypothetical protein [Kiritimatiellia bacterium]
MASPHRSGGDRRLHGTAMFLVAVLSIGGIAGTTDENTTPTQTTVAGCVTDTNAVPVAGARLTVRD